jgi:TetR/AcrR family tetracycline transcriptional repressor
MESATKESATKAGRARARRQRLTRQRVLEEALRVVDEGGLEALTMRALGERLSVEAMAIYNHVAGKQGLREGISELLWAELERSVAPDPDWRRSMRSLARGVKRLAADHPHAFPLLLASPISPAPGLRAFGAQLEVLRAAAQDEERAADILRAVIGYACGHAMIELSSLSVTEGAAGGSGLDALLALARSLPPDLPPELAEVARAVCVHDPERQFEIGLEALLAGFDPYCETLEEPTSRSPPTSRPTRARRTPVVRPRTPPPGT